MEELLGRLSATGQGMWRYRWLGVAVAWLVAVVGVAITFQIPDRYEASARVYVDTQSILKPLMSGLAVQPNVDQQVVMLSRTLISRPNVEKLVRMADLDLKADTKAEQEAIIERLMKTLEIKSTERDNLYTLSFRDSDAGKAKRVIQALVSIFVESSLGASRKDTDAAKTFLNEQIKAYEKKLEDAEARVKEFRIRNIDLQTADGHDAAGRLGELAAQLDKAKLDLREAENARDAARASLQAERTQSANIANAGSTQSLLQESELTSATPEIDARIQAQKANLDSLLQRYTDQHPDVLSARRVIKDLEEQKRKELKELRRSALGAPGAAINYNNSLAYQEMNKILAASEVQVAALRARVAEYAERYNQARNAMKNAPQIEAELAQLNRDYAIHKKNYEDLVARREAANMSGSLETASAVVDFRLIDPPRVSPRPVWPNRLLLLPLALVAALAAGLFAAFAAAELRPVFHGAGQLRSRVGLPLLGVVSLMLSDAEKRRERLDRVRFWMASGSLVGVFAVGLTVTSILAR
jgi:polysaccharide chain length determinant protein (PEP-CTERM system associated)